MFGKGFADQFGDLGRDSVNSERRRLVAVISHLSSDNPFWMRDWAIRLTCAVCRPWPKSGYLTISCNKRGRNQPSGRIRLFTGTVAGYSRTLPRRLTCRHDTAEPWVNAFRIASRRRDHPSPPASGISRDSSRFERMLQFLISRLHASTISCSCFSTCKNSRGLPTDTAHVSGPK